MNKRITKQAAPYKVEILIAGNLTLIEDICRDYCDRKGLCVTVTPTNYVFTKGSESGAIIGLINYPRFPKFHIDIWNIACELAECIKEVAQQGSYTIQDQETCIFVSTRDEDQ